MSLTKQSKSPLTLLAVAVLAITLASCGHPPRTLDAASEMRGKVKWNTPNYHIRLGRAFELGAIVPRSDVYAYAWYHVAASTTGGAISNHVGFCTRAKHPYHGSVYDDSCGVNVPWKHHNREARYVLQRLRWQRPEVVSAGERLGYKCIRSGFEDCPGDKVLE